MDEDSLHGDVIKALSHAGFDCLTAVVRVIFTRNARDFIRLHDEWSEEGRIHGGVIVLTSQPMSVGEIQRAIVTISEMYDAGQIRGHLMFLRNHR